MSRDLFAARMMEAELEANIATLAKTYGLLYYHTHRSDRSPAGFPDDVICGPSGVLFRENKRQTGRATHSQQVWLDGLRRAHLDVDIWRPSDWLDGRIVQEMSALR